MIIGLTGRISSGKGFIKDFLEKIGFEYCTISDVIREEAAKRGIEITRKNLQDLGNEVRNKEGVGGWVRRLIEKMDLNKNYIVDGIRNPGEVEELRKLNNFFLIAVDAPQEKRYERLRLRAKPSDPKTWEGFLEIDIRDFGEDDPKGQQVCKCMEMADFFIFNNSDLEVLMKRVKEVYGEILSQNNKCPVEIEN